MDEIASLSTPGLGARCLRPLGVCNRRCCTYTSAVSRLLLETPLRRCCWTRSRDPAVFHTSGCRDAVARSPLQSVFFCVLLQYAYARARTRTCTVIGQRPRAHHSFSWTFQGVRREQFAVAFWCVRSTFLAKGLGPSGPAAVPGDLSCHSYLAPSKLTARHRLEHAIARVHLCAGPSGLGGEQSCPSPAALWAFGTSPNTHRAEARIPRLCLLNGESRVITSTCPLGHGAA